MLDLTRKSEVFVATLAGALDTEKRGNIDSWLRATMQLEKRRARNSGTAVVFMWNVIQQVDVKVE